MINYGIDLGTTNSAIARMENGEPIIKETDFQKKTMASCVSFQHNQSTHVGDLAYNRYKSDRLRLMGRLGKSTSNTFIEFKRTMGTDKTHISSNMNKDYTSEELSAEILKKLKSFITDEKMNSIIITVPARFTINQNDATIRAAKLAGFEYCELLQEPIAASMAYGLGSKDKEGFWLVFDFGGGTFDAALMRVKEGIINVFDTGGDMYLGGKNIDNAIVDEIIIPYLKNNFSIDSILNDDIKREVLRDAMKPYAEEAKIQLSSNVSHTILTDLGEIPGSDDDGNEIILNITISQTDLKKTISPFFQRAIDISKELLGRNNIEGKNLSALILVGGPTYSPILQTMLKEQITTNVIANNQMTSVAIGAALYASTVDVPDDIIEKNRDKTKIQLGLGFEPATVENEESVTIKILKDKTEGTVPEKCFAEIVRTDKAWASGRVLVDEAGEVVEVKLNEDKSNTFNILIYNEQGDLIPCEPKDFSILQGTRPPPATLPYNIGIEIRSRASGKIVFRPISGLEMNQSTPATGIANGLKTQTQINPGSKSDFIKIPIYQGDYGAEGTRAIYNEYVYDVIITGEDLPNILLPEGSDVDLTIKVDRSQRITLSAFFPSLNYTKDIEVPSGTVQGVKTDWLQTELQKAKKTNEIIIQEFKELNPNIKEDIKDKASDPKAIHQELERLEKLFNNAPNDVDTKKQVLDNLRKALKKLDEIQDNIEWPKTEEELKDAFYKLEDTFKQFSGSCDELDETKIKEIINQFKEQTPQTIQTKNVKVANELIDHMRGLGFIIVDQCLGAQMEIILLKQFNDEFDMHDWSDRNKAKMLINEGLAKAQDNPSKQVLRPIVIELYKLLPGIYKPIFEDDDSVLTD